jgi:hypothetical protein
MTTTYETQNLLVSWVYVLKQRASHLQMLNGDNFVKEFESTFQK